MYLSHVLSGPHWIEALGICHKKNYIIAKGFEIKIYHIKVYIYIIYTIYHIIYYICSKMRFKITFNIFLNQNKFVYNTNIYYNYLHVTKNIHDMHQLFLYEIVNQNTLRACELTLKEKSDWYWYKEYLEEIKLLII